MELCPLIKKATAEITNDALKVQIVLYRFVVGLLVIRGIQNFIMKNTSHYIKFFLYIGHTGSKTMPNIIERDTADILLRHG